MENEKMLITAEGIVLHNALEKIDRDIKTMRLKKKDSGHLRLLAEETLGMLKMMTGNFVALMWLDRTETEVKVHLKAKAEAMDNDKKKELISIATSGKNEKAKGFMGRIGEIFSNAMMDAEDKPGIEDVYSELNRSDDEGIDYDAAWSLDSCKNSDEDTGLTDILEKSIVANIAKDVVVGVKRDTVEMTITMDLTDE